MLETQIYIRLLAYTVVQVHVLVQMACYVAFCLTFAGSLTQVWYQFVSAGLHPIGPPLHSEPAARVKYPFGTRGAPHIVGPS